MFHATELMLKEMAYLLCDGFYVNLGYFSITLKIKGVFANAADTFDPARHRTRASACTRQLHTAHRNQNVGKQAGAAEKSRCCRIRQTAYYYVSILVHQLHTVMCTACTRQASSTAGEAQGNPATTATAAVTYLERLLRRFAPRRRRTRQRQTKRALQQ